MIRAHLNDYGCLIPSSIEEALLQKAEMPGITPIAGGTEVMVWMNDAKATGRNYMSLHRLARDWRYIRTDADGTLRIGALATYTDIRHHPAPLQHFPLLVESAKVTGALQIQNRGTLAGNVANGSPAADTVPSLLAYEARITLVSRRGERTVPLASFHTGYRKNVMEPDELISEISIPRPPAGAVHHYGKVGTRQAQAISKVVFAAVKAQGHVRMAWGSLAPTTVRAYKTEKALESGATREDAWKILQTEISPIDDIRSTRVYRLKLTRNMLWEFMGK